MRAMARCGGIPCSSSRPPSRSPSPSRPMGCAASTDGAGRRRRDGAEGHSEAPATGVPAETQHNVMQEPPPAAAAGPGRRRGCKVAPEPKGGEESAEFSLPGSPSFRFYCQKAAKVEALVAAAAADPVTGVRDKSSTVAVAETPQAIIPHSSNGSPESKEVSGWLKIRGMFAAVYSLFGRHRTAASPPAAASKSHHPSAASPPAADAVSTSSP